MSMQISSKPYDVELPCRVVSSKVWALSHEGALAGSPPQSTSEKGVIVQGLF